MPQVDGHQTRPEIQALRALAVTLVVLYHLWPGRLTGGYIGVDVFFVISGFLITSHLARNILAPGRFSLADFYVRRIRRLLPASLLVLAVVGVATLVALPQTLWNSAGRQIIASAFYVQNWELSASSVDYLASGANASAVQHYWSLSVEEQFYLVWPWLMLGGVAIAHRMGRGRRGALVAVVAVVTVASLAYSIWYTGTTPAAAYFVTPTRAWEFGAGGLLALTVPHLNAPRTVRAGLSWAGLAAIAVSAWVYDSATPFPGSAALLPVLGTLAVLTAGDVGRWWSPSIIANRGPVQIIGDLSYSIYLWHWPLIILTPIALSGVGAELTGPQKIAVGALSIALGWVSKTFVEDPFRRTGMGRRGGNGLRPRTVAAATVGAMLVVAAIGGVAASISQSRINDARDALAALPDDACVGALTLDGSCQPLDTNGEVFPDPIIAARDATRQDCQVRADRSDPIRCTFGSKDAGAPTVMMIGDSHANQWMPAVEQIAADRGWKLVTYFKSSCPFNTAHAGNPSCADWNRKVLAEVEADPPTMLLTASDRDAIYENDDAIDGFRDTWSRLRAGGTDVVVLAGIPKPSVGGLLDPPSCVDDGQECDFALRSADEIEPARAAAAGMEGVTLADLTDQFCPTAGTCESIIGGALVYRDGGHMTAVYSRTLTSSLSAKLS